MNANAAFTPLRILHTEAATNFGGQEQYIYRMMLAMRSRGHHLEAVCQPHAKLAERLKQEGFTVHTMLMDGPLNYVRGVARIRGILRRGRFDIVCSRKTSRMSTPPAWARCGQPGSRWPISASRA